MLILATGTITNPSAIGALMPEETRVLDELKASAFVRSAFRSITQPGKIVMILEAPGIETAQTQARRLPFIAHDLMSLDFQQITEL
ncbi:hypothetical protein [Streptomyces sp. NPDC001100]